MSRVSGTMQSLPYYKLKLTGSILFNLVCYVKNVALTKVSYVVLKRTPGSTVAFIYVFFFSCVDKCMDFMLISRRCF